MQTVLTQLVVCMRTNIHCTCYKYRIYPCQEGYKTCYIIWGRLEWSKASAKGEARGTSKASLKHWPSPRGTKGRISLLAGTILFIPCLGYSDLGHLPVQILHSDWSEQPKYGIITWYTYIIQYNYCNDNIMHHDLHKVQKLMLELLITCLSTKVYIISYLMCT